MKIILHADDFGWDDDTVEATIDCFQKGALTSASIMPTTQSRDRAIEFALRHPQFSYGAHLTYAGVCFETALSVPASIPHLVDTNGVFRAPRKIRINGMLGRISVEQIIHETEAQLNVFKEAGLKLSHVDSHTNLHKIGPFYKALCKVLPRYGIKRMRNVQNIFIKKPKKGFTYWYSWISRQKIMNTFITTENVFMAIDPENEEWVNPLIKMMPLPGILEVGVHPGTKEFWRSKETENILIFSSKIRERGYTILNWNQLP
jgi:predicted glycoside hydrolase/deacetylase ChbG (UPF0249 family)